MGPDQPTTCKLVQGACRMQPLSNALLLALLAEASPYSGHSVAPPGCCVATSAIKQ